MIPRRMGHIWIGPHPAPEEWMATWRQAHPAWAYRLFDNDYLCNRRFRNQAHINAYFRRGKYAGVADLMRYEILFEEGGFLPEADSICLHQVDELFTEARAYTVYEMPEGRSGMMSPFLASNPGNPVIGKVIDKLSKLDPDAMGMPWTTTGNGFLRRFFQANKALLSDITVFPSHYFIPEHHNGDAYSGPDRIYARQFWGTTLRVYPHRKAERPMSKEEVEARREEVMARLAKNLAAPPA
jgi:mannosyltransferase OCH1-like enzyme